MASRPELLADAALAAAVAELAGWEVTEGRLGRTFRFADFSEAWAFMSRVALIAEQLGHHPDWSNVWSTVRIDVVTHDRGGITTLDVEFARRVDALR